MLIKTAKPVMLDQLIEELASLRAEMDELQKGTEDYTPDYDLRLLEYQDLKLLEKYLLCRYANEVGALRFSVN